MLKLRGSLVSINILLLTLTNLSGGDMATNNGKAATDERVKVMSLRLKGNSEIFFEETGGAFEIKKMEYAGYEEDPVSITRSETAIELTQKKKGSFFSSDPAALVKYHLLIPKGKTIVIEADKSKFSGRISGSDIKINAGNVIMENVVINSEGDVKMSIGKGNISGRIESAQEIKITAGAVSGEMDVIETADLKTVFGHAKLKIYRIRKAY